MNLNPNNFPNNNTILGNAKNIRGETVINSSLLLPLLQNTNNSVQAMQNPILLQNMPYGFTPITIHNLSQTQNKSNETITVTQPLVNNISSESKSISNFEETMNELQNKVVTFLYNQKTILNELNEKNDLIQDTLALLINEISALK